MAQQLVTLTGNLTADPELRFTPSGHAVASFTVAVNNGYRNADGDWVDGEALFQRVACWRDLAEHVAESLRRGNRVLVTGRLVSRQYEDKDGVTRWVTDFIADEVGAALTRATATVKQIRRDGAAAATADAWAASADTASAAPALNGAAPF